MSVTKYTSTNSTNSDECCNFPKLLSAIQMFNENAF